MTSHRQRRRNRFELEPLEGRVALSHMGAIVEDGPHHNRGGHAEVHTLRQGADDPANHDVNGGAGEAVHHNRRGKAATVTALRHGADDPANHHVNDDNGGAGEAVHQHQGGRAATAAHGRHHGADDPAGHK
jgi:hypothetical protein